MTSKAHKKNSTKSKGNNRKNSYNLEHEGKDRTIQANVIGCVGVLVITWDVVFQGHACLTFSKAADWHVITL